MVNYYFRERSDLVCGGSTSRARVLDRFLFASGTAGSATSSSPSCLFLPRVERTGSCGSTVGFILAGFALLDDRVVLGSSSAFPLGSRLPRTFFTELFDWKFSTS